MNGRSLTRRTVRRHTAAPLAIVVSVALLASGCGMRVSRDEVVAAAGGAATGPVQTSGIGDVGAAAPMQSLTAQGGTPGTGEGPAGSPGTGAAAPAAGGASTGASAGAKPGGSGSAATSQQPARANPALSEVVVGHIGEYSGVVGASTRGADSIARAGVAWINANGGLNGHPVRLVVGDSASDPSRYLTLTKTMVEQEGAIAFIGNSDPLTATAVETYLRAKNVPVLGGVGSHTVWCDSPIRFFMGACVGSWGLFVGKVAAQRSKPKVGVLACREAEVCTTLNKAFQGAEFTKTGAQLAYTAEISLAQPSLTAECLQAKSRGVETLVVLAEANTVRRAARDCVQQGYRPQFQTLDGALTDSLLSDPNLDGLIAPQPQFPWVADDTPGVKQYRAALGKYAPGVLESNPGALSWVGAMMLYRAGAKLTAAKPSAADLLAGVFSFKKETLGGLTVPTTFTKGELSPGSNCMFILEIKAQKFVAPDGSKPLCL